MKTGKILFPLMLLALMATSCDVHQFPEPPKAEDPDFPVVPDPGPGPEPDDPDKYLNLNIRLNYHTPIYLWEHIYDPKTGEVKEQYPDGGVDQKHPGTTDLYPGRLSDGVKNVAIQLFQGSSFSSYLRLEEITHSLEQDYELDIPVKIMPGQYDIVAWSDLNESEKDNRFYDTSNFGNIKINYDVYKANTDFRDTFRGKRQFNLQEDNSTVEVDMLRPMAKYEFVTTDLSEFLDRETERRNLPTRATMDDYQVKIFYSTYHPSSYNALEDWLSDSTTGVNFVTNVTITGESEASLGFDYVFINDIKDAGVQATIVVYDLQGNSVAQSQKITVPLRRDHHTVLRGAFLTINGNGGVGIDPGYNGDHNVIP